MNALILLLALAADPAPSNAPRAVIGGDETVVVGQMAELTADKSENAKSFKWILRPKPLSLKYANKEGSALFVSHDSPEIFEVELIVASADGQLDIQIGELEVKGSPAIQPASGAAQTLAATAGGAQSPSLADTIALVQQLKQLQELLQPAAPPLRAAAPPLYAQQHPLTTLEMMGRPAPEPGEGVTWPQGVKLLADRVATGNRAADGRVVAGSFRATANRIKTGLLAGDPWDEACKGARLALGRNYAPWAPFFTEAGQLVGGLRQQGALQNPEQAIDVLESAAAVLGGLQ